MSSKTIHLIAIFTAAVGSILSLASCTSTGPTDNPFRRSAEWRSYVAATSLRAGCRDGSPEAIRFVYNGDYKEEIRTYDILRTATGAVMEAHRRGSTNLLDIDLLDPLSLWRGVKHEVVLDTAAYDEIKASLLASGFRDLPDDLRLRSDTFYWVASACLDGIFRTQVWAWPSDTYERIRFIGPLTTRDGFALALKQPRPPFEKFADERRENPPFELRFRAGQIF